MLRRAPAAVLLTALGSCATPAPPPPPRPVVAPAPPARATPAPIPAGTDWRDWPLTSGDWRYVQTAGGSSASFGRTDAPPALTLTCDRATRQVRIVRAGIAASATVRTSSTTRVVSLTPRGDGSSHAALPAADPLFDAMGFSRGRFVLQQEGAVPLVVPAWAEILRVAEDCRG